jgi:hypothetical protein
MTSSCGGSSATTTPGTSRWIWEVYFAETTSRSEASVNGDSVEFKTFDLPD